jgi:hypothetical protein
MVNRSKKSISSCRQIRLRISGHQRPHRPLPCVRLFREFREQRARQRSPDLGGNFLDNKGKTVAIEGDGRQAFFRLPVFTDYAFHVILLIEKYSDHASGSGSYAVITIASRSTLLYAMTI